MDSELGMTADKGSGLDLFLVGFPGGSDGKKKKKSACNAGDLGLIPGLRRSPEEGNDYPLQYSCLQNSMDRAAWWVTVHGVTKSQTPLSDQRGLCP